MNSELEHLRKITETLTSNGYLIDQTKEWEYAFDAVPDNIFVVNTNFLVKFVNKTLANKLGIENKEEVIGIPCYAMLGFDRPMLPACEDSDPDDQCRSCFNKLDCADHNGDICNFGDHIIPKLEGAYEFTRSAIKSNAGKLLGYICVLRDVTEARMIAKSTEALLKLHNLDCTDDEKLARFILEEIVKITDSEVGYLHFVDDNGIEGIKLDLFIWSKDTMAGCEANPTRHYPLEDAGIWADSIRTSEAVIHNDYSTAPDRKGLPEGHFPIKRHMSVPIFDNSKIVAVAGVGNKLIPYTALDVSQATITLSNMWATMKRKQIERELVKTEHSLSELIRLTRTAIYEIDFIQNKFTYVNDTMCEYTGWSREELMAMGPADMLTEQSQLKWMERFAAFDRGEILPNSVEYQAKIKDGSYVWVLCSVDFRIEGGKIVGARVVAIDITEQREIENKVRDILEASPFGVHMYKYVDDQLLFIGANPAADAILGVDNTMYINKTLVEAFPDLEKHGIPERYINVMKTGTTWSATVDYVDNLIGGSFEVHAFKTSENSMAAMFKEVGTEEVLRTKVDELSNKLESTERECRLLADYLNTAKSKK